MGTYKQAVLVLRCFLEDTRMSALARDNAIAVSTAYDYRDDGIDANRTHARLRDPGERANAQLKYWRILHKVRVSPRRVGRLAKAIHVLQNYESTAGWKGLLQIAGQHLPGG